MEEQRSTLDTMSSSSQSHVDKNQRLCRVLSSWHRLLPWRGHHKLNHLNQEDRSSDPHSGFCRLTRAWGDGGWGYSSGGTKRSLTWERTAAGSCRWGGGDECDAAAAAAAAVVVVVVVVLPLVGRRMVGVEGLDSKIRVSATEKQQRDLSGGGIWQFSQGGLPMMAMMTCYIINK